MAENKRLNQREKEHNRLMKIINFRFPHRYKYIGLISAVLLFGFLLAYKFYGSNLLLVKDVCRSVLLLLLLVASLSKDSIEDEYVSFIRSQSYVLAFICAAAYAILLPLTTFLISFLMWGISYGDKAILYEVSAFEVLFMLICFQLLFFETLKRFGRAE